jgi:hypothetical protein
MSKVVCRACGRPFTIVGIINRGEDCFCSIPCLRENLAVREESQNAVVLEFYPKAPDNRMFANQSEYFPKVGMLGH